MSVTKSSPLKITVLFDNREFDPRLSTDWGFSALVEFRGSTLLLDTGGNAEILLENIRLLDIDPAIIEDIMISHDHRDHVGGLKGILSIGRRPRLFLLPEYADDYRDQNAEIIETFAGQMLMVNFYSTGRMGEIPEQGLIIQTDLGLILVTGCAHPGIVEMIEKAVDLYSEPVYLVLGGFHLEKKSPAEMQSILTAFKRLGVKKVGPTHCTGDRAIQMFADAYGPDFLEVGVGRILSIE